MLTKTLNYSFMVIGDAARFLSGIFVVCIKAKFHQYCTQNFHRNCTQVSLKSYQSFTFTDIVYQSFLSRVLTLFDLLGLCLINRYNMTLQARIKFTCDNIFFDHHFHKLCFFHHFHHYNHLYHCSTSVCGASSY